MPPPHSAHAQPQRGFDSTPGSSTRDGRFGRMFRTLPPLDLPEATGEQLLADLAAAMATNFEDPLVRELQIVTEGGKDAGDDEENFAIPAGYTYLGQFIDHDITFDPGSSLTKLNDPDALHNFRTPALDLDSVYGSGPDDEPFRYEGDKFILGTPLTGSPDTRAKDLPRAANHRAIIGDHRNDENVIVAQLHSVMMRFHNAIIDDLPDTRDRFKIAQQRVQWHYQWVVIWDFLSRICGKAVVEDILPMEPYVGAVHGTGHTALAVNVRRPRLLFYQPQERSFMPVEFSGAAYRFGHSMVRPFYRLNEHAGPFATFSADPKTSLSGFQPIAGDPRKTWAIDWRLFFPAAVADQALVFAQGGRPEMRLQPSYKIDTQIVHPLVQLPPAQFGPGFHSLALRNLVRGWRLGLPSGQAVARAMGVKPLNGADLVVGPGNTPIENIAGGIFAEDTPLWLYVLAEAQKNMETSGKGVVRPNTGSATLGPVGARIVAETIIGLIAEDRFSFLRNEPNWTPHYGRTTGAGRVFEMGDLIAKAIEA